MVKVLVTGGAGNVGGALVSKLVENPRYQVVVVDNLLTGSWNKVPAEKPNLTCIKADVNNLSELSVIMSSHSFDYVFHYAAMVGVKRTLQNPLSVLNDIEGIKNVLSLSKNTGVKRIFYASSSEVYGEPVEFPQNEHTTPLNSKLPYAIVKNVGEAFFRSYQKEYGLDYTIFRFFNTYGPNQSTDFVAMKFIKAALMDQDITIYGNGKQSRTFCYVDDNVETTMRILEERICVNDIINIGSEIEFSILELAETIIAVTGSKSKIVHLPALEEGDMTRRLPEISKMKEILRRAPIRLESGIQNVLRLKFNVLENVLIK
jgi:nucleoside-diphosphate-sugar epimerase